MALATADHLNHHRAGPSHGPVSCLDTHSRLRDWSPDLCASAFIVPSVWQPVILLKWQLGSVRPLLSLPTPCPQQQVKESPRGPSGPALSALPLLSLSYCLSSSTWWVASSLEAGTLCVCLLLRRNRLLKGKGVV